jgi:hypothetical protein
MTHLRTGLLLAQLALIAVPGLAFGQTAPTMPIEQVKDCLCQQQQLDAVSNRMSAASTAYAQRQQELQRVEQELAEVQRGATPGDPQAVAKAQDLVDRRNLLRSQLRDEYGPYQSASQDYNQRAERYNATCTKMPMLSFDIAAAKENLSCPAP